MLIICSVVKANNMAPELSATLQLGLQLLSETKEFSLYYFLWT